MSRPDADAQGEAGDDATDPARRTRRNVLIVLPYDMSARNVINTPIAGLLAQQDDLRVTMVSRDPADAERLGALPGNAIGWVEMLRPFRYREGVHRFLADARYALGFYLYVSLAYRFNAITGFRGFRERLRQSLGLRWTAFREGLPTLRCLGWPCPRSRRLCDWLYDLNYAGWLRHPSVEALFERSEPDLVVLAHLQTGLVTPYVLAAKARGIPVLGANGSWDQPTTKGPLAPDIRHIMVQSARVKADLEHYHGYPGDRITVTGWPQMDIYSNGNEVSDRPAFLERLGLPENQRYVLVGAYSHRLGYHEPAMCRGLAERIRDGFMGDDVTLYIRCHPLELRWRERFGELHDPPTVIVEPPQLGNLAYLAELLRHAAVVIASAGTINLDAAALDTPTIAVAFENDDEPYYDRPGRRYDMEHYAAVAQTGGVRLAHSQTALEDAAADYLKDPKRDAEGRQRLRAEHLEPLDGRASRRFVDAVATMALHGRPQ